MASSSPVPRGGAPGRGSLLPILPRSRLTSRFDYLLSIVILALITSSPSLSSSLVPPGVVAAASHQPLLPYIPTTILIPEANTVPLQQNATPDIAYIFSPRDGDPGAVELLALNISANVGNASSSSTAVSLSTHLPFLPDPGENGSSTVAFSASLADNGTIIVFAGDCSSPTTESSIWTLDPSVDSNGGGGASWTRQSTAAEDNGAGSGGTKQCGPGFLGSSLSFSTTLEPEMSKATVYVYGGMCPDTNADEMRSAQSNATYSNQMLRIAPSENDKEGEYVVAPATSKGPPVASAGFTLTALPPSIANRSSGSVTQQVNYVLLGGHTRNAFVDMGTVALWSLPEETWGFVSEIKVEGSESTNSNSDFELAVKSEDDAPESIDSRSGHTAVLNEDGTSLVVLGGWVGDLNQAAEPQLAILHVGADYGGDGEWRWSVPADAQPPGSGIYGHGATLLPGNVMLVYGGYNISPSGGGRATKRQGSGGGSGVPMFLNLTSMTWTDDYTNPLSRTAPNDNNDETTTDGEKDTSEDKKKRLGFGLGLGLGLLAIIVGVLAYLFYRRRQRHRRTIRNSALQALAQDNSHFIHDDFNEMAESRHSGGGGGGGVFPWYAGGPDPHGKGANALGYRTLHSGSRQVRGGNLMTSALPPRGGPAGRGQYQPTATGPIHPIYEADEETSLHDGGGGAEKDGEDDDGDVGAEPLCPVREGEKDSERDREPTDRDSARYSDPFATPTTQDRPVSFPQAASRASMTPSPERERRTQTMTTDPEVQDWMTDIDAADALLSGRMAAATAAASSRQAPAGPSSSSPTNQTFRPSLMRRATDKSTRSARSLGAFFGGVSGGAAGGGTGDDESRTESNISESNRSGLTPSRSDSVRSQLHLRAPGFGIAASTAAAEGRTGTGNSGGSGVAGSEGSGSGSGSAASPSYNTARSSFQTLRAEGPSLLLGRQRDATEGGDDEPLSPPGSPSKSKPQRRSGWLGSLRRVFSGPSPSPPGSSQGSDGNSGHRGSPRRGSFAEAANDIDAARLGGLGSIAAGGLLRRKGGRGAWETDGGGGGGGESSRMGAAAGEDRYARARGDGAQAGAEDDDEWDIEKAIERRLVQVMFTVPKERLRVVNAEPEIDDAMSGVLVNPGDEEEEDEADERRALVSVHSLGSEDAEADAEGGCRLSTHTVPSLRLEIPRQETPRGDERQQQKQQGRHEEEGEKKQDLAGTGRGLDVSDEGKDDDGKDDGNERREKKRGSRLSALEHEIELLGAELEAQRASQPSRTASDLHSEGDVFSAEAVRLERPAAPYHSPHQSQPRTRVLEMVESIESLSRDHSPASSPARSPSPLKGKDASAGIGSGSPVRALRPRKSELGRD